MLSKTLNLFLSGDFGIPGKMVNCLLVAAGPKLDSMFYALSFGCFSSRENSGHLSPRYRLCFLCIYLLLFNGFSTVAFWALWLFIFEGNDIFLNVFLGVSHALARESASPFYY